MAPSGAAELLSDVPQTDPCAHCRLQREQIRSLGSSAMDCGPAELHFCITDPELLTNSSRELNRLREEKAKLEMQLQELQKVGRCGWVGRVS